MGSVLVVAILAVTASALAATLLLRRGRKSLNPPTGRREPSVDYDLRKETTIVSQPDDRELVEPPLEKPKEEQPSDEDPSTGSEAESENEKGFGTKTESVATPAQSELEQAGNRVEASREGVKREQVDTRLERELIDDGKRVQGVAPIDRGGRPRSQGSLPAPEAGPSDDATRETTSRAFRPELVIEKKGYSWEVFLEIPDFDLAARCAVIQGQAPVDPVTGSRFPIFSFQERLHVSCGDRNKSFALFSDGASHLIFKTRKDWSSPGRLVSRVTSGYFLIVFPSGWSPVEGQSLPIEPEAVTTNPRCEAHFVTIDSNERIPFHFRSKLGADVPLVSDSFRFELVGNEIHDDAEHMGPLFGSEPPQIRASDATFWEEVKTVIVGEEGPRAGGWKDEFSPVAGAPVQTLPERLGSRSGWYFSRLYDHDGSLVDSMDFRFCRALEKLSVSVNEVPGAGGHGSASILFQHADGLECRLKNRSLSEYITVESGVNETRIGIGADFRCDKTEWKLIDETSGSVSFFAFLPRLWWNISATSKPRQWIDEIIEVSTEKLDPTSRMNLWVRVPPALTGKRVRVGVTADRTKTYPLPRNGDVKIPLRDFFDVEEMIDEREAFSLYVFLRDGEQQVVSVRARWKVIGLEVSQDYDGTETILRFKWQEVGNASGKSLKLTGPKGAGTSFEDALDLPEDAQEAELRAPMSKVRVGEYVLEIWGEEKDAERCLSLQDVIQLKSTKELLKNAIIRLSSVTVNGASRSLEDHYTIRVTGRIIHGRVSGERATGNTLVKDINDGWYLGELSIFRSSRGDNVTNSFVDNPVKFELTNYENRIVAIEDRDGDGLVFCERCKKLFWRREWQKNEERRGHRDSLFTDHLFIGIRTEHAVND